MALEPLPVHIPLASEVPAHVVEKIANDGTGDGQGRDDGRAVELSAGRQRRHGDRPRQRPVAAGKARR